MALNKNIDVHVSILAQERLFLLLQVTLGLGAFSTVATILLIGSGHRDNYITAGCIPECINPKNFCQSMKERLGDRYYRYLVVTARIVLLVTALLCFVLPIALSPTAEKGSVTLLVAGSNPVISFSLLPASLFEYNSDDMAQKGPKCHAYIVY